MNAMAFALVLPVAGGREQGAQQVKDGRVGELDPERGNVNDCALDEVLRRHNRPPTSPGEMLLEEFLVPMDMTQRALAEELGLSVQTVNLIIKGKRGITAETAVRLSRVFKNSPQFWLGLQMDWDLWHAERDLAEVG